MQYLYADGDLFYFMNMETYDQIAINAETIGDSLKFVKENETVEKGQTIATVGESSSFEISDDSHLHFEMYKDGELVNPTIYLK